MHSNTCACTSQMFGGRSKHIRSTPPTSSRSQASDIASPLQSGRSAMARNRATTWTLGFLALAASVFALLPLRSQLGEADVALIFLLVVLGASATGGRRLGVTIAFTAFLLFDVLFLPPYNTLWVRNPFDWLVLIVFLITSLVAAQLLYRARSERAAVENAEALRQADQL